MGLGKTTVVIEQVLAAQVRVDVYVPDLALAEELQRKIQSLGGQAIVIRGRTAPVSSEPVQLPHATSPLKMCRKALAIERLQKMGAASLGGDQLCRRYLRGEGRYELCEYFGDCAYIQQHTKAPVDTLFVIRAHDYLALERGWLDLELERRIGGAIFHVVDEDPVARLITHQTFPLEQLVPEYQDRRGWLDVIVQALRKGGNSVATFLEHLTGSDSASHDEDESWARVQEAIEDLIEECPDHGVSGVRPSMSTQDLLNRLERGVRIDHWPDVLQAMRDAIMQRKNFTNAISVDRRDGIQMVHVDRLRPAARVASRRTRLLLLDGSADRLALNQVFGPLCEHEIQVRRQARILQVQDKLFSDAQIRADNWRRQDILGLLELHKLTDQPGVVTRKSLTGHFVELGIATLHHGNLRGKDIMKLANPIVIVGRMQPPPPSIESQARALYPFDDLNLVGTYDRQEAVYRVSSTQVQIFEQQSFTHADPRVNARLTQARDCEQLQAIDRGRLIHCETPKTVLVFTKQPISDELEVELVKVDDLLGPAGLMELLAKAHGRLPLNFRWLMEFDPVQFPHEFRAKDFSRRVIEWTRRTPLPVIRLIKDRQPGARGRTGHAALWIGLHTNRQTEPEKEGCQISSI